MRLQSMRESRHTLLLVDDEPANLQVLRHTLQNDYRLLFAKDGNRALELIRDDKPSLVLLDIMMPGMSGYEVCEALKADESTVDIPVIFITALTDASNEEKGLNVGAIDYISKPFNPGIVRARVRNHLKLAQAEALRQTRLDLMRRLGMAAEFKDPTTGQHIMRMSYYAHAVARAAGYGEIAAEEIFNAAPLHDVGKIGVPDEILKKPSGLTEDEWIVMRQHPSIGAQIIGEHADGVLKMAYHIALSHHEKWDGTGYPQGLKGDEIPHAAHIVALADVFDALTSERPYKKAWPLDETFAYIREQGGKHFSPELIEIFLRARPEIERIYALWTDNPHG